MRDVRESLGRLNGANAAISLAESVPRLARRLEEAGLSVECSVNGSEEGYNYSVLLALYRFAQEGVTNALKHSGAKSVRMSLILGDDASTMVVGDDGRGFDQDRTPNAEDEESRYGLLGLHRRLELVQGLLDVKSAPGEGTVLKASVPKDPVYLLGESS